MGWGRGGRAALAVAVALAGCSERPDREPPARPSAGASTHPSAPATYAGSDTCRECHASEYARWRGSHHDRAMEEPTDASVLGDFDDAALLQHGVRSRFFRRDGGFAVETDGPDGDLAAFSVRYTFGVAPLQQYLVELRPGRLQALPLAWDTRPADAGGQRWFHVYGDDRVGSDDVLHWTRLGQSWESMCAECHSTALVTRYDVARDRFETRWEELDVGCEACHGPASAHLAWARAPSEDPRRGFALRFDEREGVRWTLDPVTGNSRRSRPRTTQREIDTCAPCHSRRTRLTNAFVPGDALLDHHRPVWVEPPLYHADGQMRDEVYVWGSFLQSRMHRSGVTCSDCHDPHGLGLRADGARVCLTCHAAPTFATTAHHGHALDSPGADCLACHMPTTTYMQVDARHDHSFRVPRPALAAATGVPDPCTRCHADGSPTWAADALPPRPPSPPHWTEQLGAAHAQAPPDQVALLAVSGNLDAPTIVRASATSLLDLSASADALGTTTRLLASPDALLRLAATEALATAPPDARLAAASTMLGDPVRSVRFAALEALLPLGRASMPAAVGARLDAVAAEYLVTQDLHAERAEAQVSRGNLHWAYARLADAAAAFRTAIALNPSFVPAYVNLAELLRTTGREPDAEAVLREGLGRLPEQPTLAYALGLSLVRQGRRAEALASFQAAAQATDAEPTHVVAHALALAELGRARDAVAALEAGLRRFPRDATLTATLASLRRTQPPPDPRSRRPPTLSAAPP